MHKEESRTDFGVIKIHKNVIASIASLAALEIDGVKRVGVDFKNGLLDAMARKVFPVIKVEIDRNEEVRLDVPIIIKYEFNIPEVANKVQERIRAALERMTNLSIKDININVQGIERG